MRIHSLFKLNITLKNTYYSILKKKIRNKHSGKNEKKNFLIKSIYSKKLYIYI